jgi:hypothetical protein
VVDQPLKLRALVLPFMPNIITAAFALFIVMLVIAAVFCNPDGVEIVPGVTSKGPPVTPVIK